MEIANQASAQTARPVQTTSMAALAPVAGPAPDDAFRNC
jgi:hypothetical protein